MQPDVLVLDEPTAALDSASEGALIAGVQAWRGCRTLIVITHRFSAARLCGRVVRLSAGGVEEVEDGFEYESAPARAGACGEGHARA